MTNANETPRFYAAIDNGSGVTGAVYGIGASEGEALGDAREETDTSGRFRAVPCTRAAYYYVMDHGGAPSPMLTVTCPRRRVASAPRRGEP